MSNYTNYTTSNGNVYVTTATSSSSGLYFTPSTTYQDYTYYEVPQWTTLKATPWEYQVIRTEPVYVPPRKKEVEMKSTIEIDIMEEK